MQKHAPLSVRAADPTNTIGAADVAPRVLVLGIGNILWADEGFGVRCVEDMAARYRFPANVTLLDGGTQGIYLVDQVRAADVLVVFDAVDYGLVPGTLKQVRGDAVPSFLGAKKMSLHQTGFQEVLALAKLLGGCPEHLLLIGVQPQALEDFGGSLTRVVRAQVGPAVDMALAELTGLGIEPVSVADADAAAEPALNAADLPHPALGLHAYEQGRPPPDAACRVGDARVLLRRAQGSGGA